MILASINVIVLSTTSLATLHTWRGNRGGRTLSWYWNIRHAKCVSGSILTSSEWLHEISKFCSDLARSIRSYVFLYWVTLDYLFFVTPRMCQLSNFLEKSFTIYTLRKEGQRSSTQSGNYNPEEAWTRVRRNRLLNFYQKSGQRKRRGVDISLISADGLCNKWHIGRRIASNKTSEDSGGSELQRCGELHVAWKTRRGTGVACLAKCNISVLTNWKRRNNALPADAEPSHQGALYEWPPAWENPDWAADLVSPR